MQSLSSDARFLSSVGCALQATESQAEHGRNRWSTSAGRVCGSAKHPALSIFECLRKGDGSQDVQTQIIAFIYAPMNQDGIDNLRGHRHDLLNDMSQHDRLQRILDDEGWHHLLLRVTPEKVRVATIELVLTRFYNDGIDRYSLDIILGGWQVFSPNHGDIYWNQLFSIITGFDCFDYQEDDE
jgi:hypothetical protein